MLTEWQRVSVICRLRSFLFVRPLGTAGIRQSVCSPAGRCVRGQAIHHVPALCCRRPSIAAGWLPCAVGGLRSVLPTRWDSRAGTQFGLVARPASWQSGPSQRPRDRAFGVSRPRVQNSEHDSRERSQVSDVEVLAADEFLADQLADRFLIRWRHTTFGDKECLSDLVFPKAGDLVLYLRDGEVPVFGLDCQDDFALCVHAFDICHGARRNISGSDPRTLHSLKQSKPATQCSEHRCCQHLVSLATRSFRQEGVQQFQCGFETDATRRRIRDSTTRVNRLWAAVVRAGGGSLYDIDRILDILQCVDEPPPELNRLSTMRQPPRCRQGRT
jgi:hypothetical protein